MSSSLDEVWVVVHLPEGEITVSGSGEFFVESKDEETSVMLDEARLSLIKNLDEVLANA